MNFPIQWITALVITCKFLLGTCSETNAQSFFYADSLFTAKKYEIAAIEYERLNFLLVSPVGKNKALLNKALCYKAMSNYKKAAGQLSRCKIIFMDDSLRSLYLYESAVTNYLANNMAMAEIYAAQLYGQSKAALYKKAAYALMALSQNEKKQWEKAHKTLKKYLNEFHPKNKLLANTIDSLYNKKNIPKLKSQKKAFWLGLVPGLGMAYAGKPLEGLANFTINLAAFALGAYEVYCHYYITGYFVGALIIQKFYFGGRTHTTYLVNKYNHDKSTDFNKQIKHFILDLK